MNYSKIRNFDIANGEGVRVSLFVSGCTNNCPGCFNVEQQDFTYGEEYTALTHMKIAGMLEKSCVDGLSILGGEPLCQDEKGIKWLLYLAVTAHRLNKSVWLWTGYRWEDIPHITDDIRLQLQILNLIEMCDIVIDGPYVQELSSPSLVWRGSSNQRVIDVKATCSNEKTRIVLYRRK